MFLLNFICRSCCCPDWFSASARGWASARASRGNGCGCYPPAAIFRFAENGQRRQRSTFAAVFALAGTDFGLRAWKSRKLFDLWNSILARWRPLLIRASKASNLPLLLPWAILIFPLIPLLRKKIAATALVILIAAAVSFLPTAILNAHYCGDWSGAKLEPDVMTVKNPLVAVGGNVFQLLLDNFCPPFFPQADWWNQHATEILPRFLVAASEKFNNGLFHLGELPAEDWAGLGFGLSALLALVSFIVVANFPCFASSKKNPARTDQMFPLRFHNILLLAPWLALLFYCAKSGMDTAARLISPYYPLLIPLLLVGAAQSEIIRRRWWRVLVCGNLVLAFAVLILTPGRELWPAQAILSKLAAQNPGSHLLSRAQKVYSVYADRSDPLACVPRFAAARNFRRRFRRRRGRCGYFVVAAGLAHGAWSNFCWPISGADSEAKNPVLRSHVSGMALGQNSMTLDGWLQKSGAELVATTNAVLKISTGVQTWHVVRFKN